VSELVKVIKCGNSVVEELANAGRGLERSLVQHLVDSRFSSLGAGSAYDLHLPSNHALTQTVVDRGEC
jgi:hypothetical protein